MAVMDFLFKRLQPTKGQYAVEAVSLGYLLFTTLLALCLFGKLDHPVKMLLDRVCIAAFTFVLIYVYRKMPCRLTAFLRVGYQLALLSYWYPDTYEFNRLFPNLDHIFATAEQTLFGAQPAYWFQKALPQLAVSEVLNMGYFAYYPLIALVVVWYYLKRYEQFERVAFVIATSFFIYYVIYIFLPVAGPQFYFPAIGQEQMLAGVFPAVGDYFNLHPELLPSSDLGHGFFYSLVEHSQAVGERPTAAFPSSHVGISTVLMILAWRGNRKLCACMAPFYIALCMATVYIQAHYLIDVLGGWISAILIYLLSERMYKCFVPRG